MDPHFEEVPKERGGSTVGMNSHRWYWSDTEGIPDGGTTR